MTPSLVGHLVLLVIVAIISAKDFFAMAGHPDFEHGDDTFSQTGFVCHGCTEAKQCRTKKCYYGRCVDNRRDFRACTRNSFRECADCKRNDDCIYGQCKGMICAYDHDIWKRCQKLLHYEHKLKQSMSASHMDLIDDGLINFDDLELFSADDISSVKISLADVKSAENEERWGKLTVRGASAPDMFSEGALKEEMRDVGYSMKDSELILEGFGGSEELSPSSAENHVEGVGRLAEELDVHGLSLVPDYADHLGDEYNFDLDQFEVIDEYMEDNLHSFL